MRHTKRPDRTRSGRPCALPLRSLLALILLMTTWAGGLGGCRWRRREPARPPSSTTPATPPGERSQAPQTSLPASPSPIAWERVTPGQYPAAEIADWVEKSRQSTGVYFFTFDKDTYVLVAWGQQPTSGYAVEVRGVHAATGGPKDRAQLEVNFRRPSPNMMTAQVLTYPYDLIRVPRQIRTFDLRLTGDEPPNLPKTREPSIQIDLPTPGATVSNPLTLRGRARVYEGVVRVYLEDGHNVLYDKPHSGPGAPAWWNMDLRIRYATPTSPHGMLQVYWHSPRDGAKQDVVMIPVRFAS